MQGSPKISLINESLRHIQESTGQFGDIWLHEGLKHGVERVLDLTSRNRITRWLLEQVSGGLVTDPRLETSIGGKVLEGPLGIAPGWDKPGTAVLGWQTLGANHITPGGVTLFGQGGNPMPRLRTFDKRVGDHGKSRSLNSYGFPGPPADTVTYNIADQKETGEVRIPVFVQATLNKEWYEPANRDRIPEILAITIKKLLPAADGINLGLSSLNTANMRDAQSYELLYKIMNTVREIVPSGMPLGYKGDGDGGEERLDMYCRLVLDANFDYIELINSTGKKEIKAKYGAEHLPGGLAGADEEFQQMAVDAVRYVYEAIGDKVDIIGMGGINNEFQALKMIRAGASALGINSAVRELGARAVNTIELGLSDLLDDAPLAERLLLNQIGVGTDRGPKCNVKKSDL